MLTILQDKDEIRSAQRKLSSFLIKQASRTILVKISYPAGRFDGTIHWLASHKMWFYTEKTRDKYFNFFQLRNDEPSPNQQVGITCEANVPIAGINRRNAGAFAKDERGNVFLVHRGKIGGGKKGVGKSLFVRQYLGKFLPAIDGARKSQVAIIGLVASQRFLPQVRAFIEEVERIKAFIAQKPQKRLAKLNRSFTEEPYKKSGYSLNRDVIPESDHALIVKGLASELHKWGYKFANDKQRDLYILKTGNKLNALFEVKSGHSTTELYCGIGQLLVNSAEGEGYPKLILVVPEGLSAKWKGILNQLGIKALEFHLNKETTFFPKLRTLLCLP